MLEFLPRGGPLAPAAYGGGLDGAGAVAPAATAARRDAVRADRLERVRNRAATA